MSEEFIRKVITNFKIETTKISFGGYIPTNIIGYAEHLQYNLVIWRTIPQQSYLTFKKDLGIPSGKYAIPGLVWVFSNDLDLYAYQEWNGEETDLFWAPFYNVNQESVCLGTASKYVGDGKMFTFKAVMERVETAFFNSTFTHIGSEHNVKNSFLGLHEKTFEKKGFPYDYLVPCEMNVRQLCNKLFNTSQ